MDNQNLENGSRDPQTGLTPSVVRYCNEHCYVCGGIGKILRFKDLKDGYVWRKCPRCHGTGEKKVALSKGKKV